MTGGGRGDPYAELGVSRDASAEEIRRAYRDVARRHHPDVSQDPGGPERFAVAARAYAILSDPAARARHDRRLPRPVQVGTSRSSRVQERAAIDRRGTLVLADREAAHLAHQALTLTGRGGRIVVPAGTDEGDQLVLWTLDRLITLDVRVEKNT